MTADTTLGRPQSLHTYSTALSLYLSEFLNYYGKPINLIGPIFFRVKSMEMPRINVCNYVLSNFASEY